jgi:WXG100 family type VII secretion target
MPTIHINTDLLRQLGQHFNQLNEQVQNQIQPLIYNTAGQLEADWQGTSRHQFDSMYSDWHTQVDRIVASGQDISRHLQTTADQFEQADRSM